VTASHIHSYVHNAAPNTTIAVRNGARLAGTILCLAALPSSSWHFASASTNTFTVKAGCSHGCGTLSLLELSAGAGV